MNNEFENEYTSEEETEKIAELEDNITQLQVALVEVYELYSASTK